MTDKALDEMALEYHRFPVAGKLRIEPTKRMVNQRDLALAYSPGVAAACTLIAEDDNAAAEVTARGNLVAVISNGTAVLGLGSIGPLASKPVMEGKAVLFKKFADIDCFDIEVDEPDAERLADLVARLEPTFGAVNLEDIKAPECFEVERLCQERMSIPVFHDDQHGTAIVVGAAITNGLALAGKRIEKVSITCAGAGAAALACLNVLVSLGAKRENIFVSDVDGVVYEGRAEGMDPYKAAFARKTDKRTLEETFEKADVFLGLSAPDIVKPEWVKRMAKNPIIMALANPDPEIRPDVVKEVRSDAIIATGRSDFPNQVNNVLCFPFIFRGALDVGATTINEEMKRACVHAIAGLAKAEPSDVVARAYKDATLRFGREYILPKPFDPRLIHEVAPAVAQAAMDTGVARRPIEDMEAYRRKLTTFVYRSGQVMEPVFEAARRNPRRVAFVEGEDPRVLRAAQIALDDQLAFPILIGRRPVMEAGIAELGLRLKLGENVDFIDPTDNPKAKDYRELYLSLAERRGVTPDMARDFIATRGTVLAATMVRAGDADTLLCGATDRYRSHLDNLCDIICVAPGVNSPAAMRLIILKDRFFFISDTNVQVDPDAEAIAATTELAAQEVRRFGLTPRVALCSHSNFGASVHGSAPKMREALALLRARNVDFEVDGEMRANVAIMPEIRDQIVSSSPLTGAANLLVMPDLDCANIAYNLCWAANDGLSVGPILIGMAHPVHILSNSVTVRGIVNMTAIAVADAQDALDGTK